MSREGSHRARPPRDRWHLPLAWALGAGEPHALGLGGCSAASGPSRRRSRRRRAAPPTSARPICAALGSRRCARRLSGRARRSCAARARRRSERTIPPEKPIARATSQSPPARSSPEHRRYDRVRQCRGLSSRAATIRTTERIVGVLIRPRALTPIKSGLRIGRALCHPPRGPDNDSQRGRRSDPLQRANPD